MPQGLVHGPTLQRHRRLRRAVRRRCPAPTPACSPGDEAAAARASRRSRRPASSQSKPAPAGQLAYTATKASATPGPVDDRDGQHVRRDRTTSRSKPAHSGATREGRAIAASSVHHQRHRLGQRQPEARQLEVLLPGRPATAPPGMCRHDHGQEERQRLAGARSGSTRARSRCTTRRSRRSRRAAAGTPPPRSAAG